jgi:multiple sugar transport system substrate-binding protein
MGLGIVVPILSACRSSGLPAAPSGNQGQAASGSPGAAAGEVSLVYYTSTEPAHVRMQKQEAAINRLLPDVKLTIIPTPTNPIEKFVTMQAGGTPPDLCWAGVLFWQLAPQDVLMPLDDLVAADKSFNLSEYYAQAIDMFRYKGKLLGLPYGVNTHVIALNKTLLQRAGVTAPTSSWTIPEYITLARRLTVQQGGETTQWGGWIDVLQIAIWMFGGQIYDKAFTKSLIDQPEAIEGLQFFYDQNLGTLKIAPQSGSKITYFGNAQLAMMNVGPFNIPQVRQFEGIQWDLLTMPYTEKRTRGTWMSGEGYIMAKETKNRGGAWAVLKYLCGREAMADFYAPEFMAIPAVRLVAETNFANSVPGVNARAHLESIQFATPYAGHPVVARWGEAITPMWDAIRKGEKSVRDAAREAAQRLDQLLKETPA